MDPEFPSRASTWTLLPEGNSRSHIIRYPAAYPSANQRASPSPFSDAELSASLEGHDAGSTQLQDAHEPVASVSHPDFNSESESEDGDSSAPIRNSTPYDEEEAESDDDQGYQNYQHERYQHVEQEAKCCLSLFIMNFVRKFLNFCGLRSRIALEVQNDDL